MHGERTLTTVSPEGNQKRTKRPPAKARGVFERDGVWWICWACPRGHMHREKIGPKGLALTEYQKRKVAVKTAGFCLTQARLEKPTAFQAAAERYLAWAGKERPRSVMFREKALKHLKARFGGETLDAISKPDVEAYLASRRDEGAAPGMVNRECSGLSHLFSKAITWGLVKANPVSGSDRQAERNEKPRPLMPDEKARLFAVLPEHYKPFVTLALHTGLRLGELHGTPGMAGYRPSWGHADGHTAKIGEGRNHSPQRDGPCDPGGTRAGDFRGLPDPPEEADGPVHPVRCEGQAGGPDVSLPAGHLHLPAGRARLNADPHGPGATSGLPHDAAVERLADRGCQPEAALVDSLLALVKNEN
jgi:hypothetical protein